VLTSPAVRRPFGLTLTAITVAALIGPLAGHATAAAAKPPKKLNVTVSATVPVATPISNGGSTGQTSITFTFSSSVATATFTCSRDGAKAKACTSPVTVTGVTDGAHSFRVSAAASGYHRRSATFTWTVDHSAPPAVTFAGVPTHPVATSPAITFTGESGDTFACSIDGGALATCTPGSSGTSGVTGQGAHTVTVVPTDAAGNPGPSASAGWTIDTTAPVVVINNPPANPTNATSQTVNFTSNDPTAVTTCKLNGSTVSCPAGSWSGSGLTNGTTYTLVVTATDPAGNHSADSATWKVDTMAADPPGLSSKPNGITKQTSGSFSFATGDATDTYQCALDPADPASPPFATCTSGVSTADSSLPGHATTLAEGTHAFFVRAVDVALNHSAAVEYDWVVDTTPPVLDVSGLPTEHGNRSSVAPIIGITDANPVAATCNLVGPTASSTCGPYSGLADGDYTLTISDSDAAGNAATPVVAHWSVDTVAPAVTIHAPSTLTTPVRFSLSEAVSGTSDGLVQLALADSSSAVPAALSCRSGSATVPCSGPYDAIVLTPSKPLVPGQHYQAVFADGTAQDAAGNVAVAAVSSFRGQQKLAARNTATRYSWAAVKSSSAIGHSYRTEHLAGAKSTWAFKGSSLTWWTRTGPTQGRSFVLVDGHRVGSVNNYARTTRAKVRRTYRHLGKGAHAVTIVVRGVKGATRARGTAVAIDAFTAAGHRTVNPALSSSWGTLKKAARADLAKAQLVLRFRGTSFAWGTKVGKAMGIAKVYVDKNKPLTVDNYATATKAAVQKISGLTDALHTVRIVVTGHHHAHASGSQIVVTRFKIG
jgi:hypothetical protein